MIWQLDPVEQQLFGRLIEVQGVVSPGHEKSRGSRGEIFRDDLRKRLESRWALRCWLLWRAKAACNGEDMLAFAHTFDSSLSSKLSGDRDIMDFWSNVCSKLLPPIPSKPQYSGKNISPSSSLIFLILFGVWCAKSPYCCCFPIDTSLPLMNRRLDSVSFSVHARSRACDGIGAVRSKRKIDRKIT